MINEKKGKKRESGVGKVYIFIDMCGWHKSTLQQAHRPQSPGDEAVLTQAQLLVASFLASSSRVPVNR